jgi:hypothetical protein
VVDAVEVRCVACAEVRHSALRTRGTTRDLPRQPGHAYVIGVLTKTIAP